MSSAASVKDKLKNYAKKSGRLFGDVLTVYVLERVLFRISKSEYMNNFTLKGGILLYALYEDDFTRATTDIDLLGRNITNDKDELKSVFAQILSIETDDPIRFDINAIEVINITEFKKYHGVNIGTTAYIDKTKVPVSIDIGFGDIVYPERIMMEYPTVLDNDAPQIFAYSTYSIVAEKMEAIASLGVTNSRYKDFYDLCTLSEREDFDGELLREAIIETFKNRNTTFDDIAAFEESFRDNYERQQRWNGFLRNKKVSDARSFSEAVSSTKSFLLPVIDAIRQNNSFKKRWIHTKKQWREK
ncbi:MAG: nucleotidyl transferase AbiEii/AbiGii toxin family protein [Clostridiaceae bacterium]|jgi:predicted nucleotidyltransferase component of viral defense system|nr:nucleotidyl transferase AbiEii/AbiGii toxin family protein [Clostridiaceae bacterium]